MNASWNCFQCLWSFDITCRTSTLTFRGTSGEEMLINPAKVILDELKTLEKFDEQLAQKEDEKKATDIQNNSQQDVTSKLNTKASLPEKKCVRNDDSSDKGQEVHLHAKLETEGGGRSLSTLRTDLKQSKVEELVKKCEHLNVLDSDDDNDDDDESRETSTSITKSQQVDAVSSVSKVSVRIKQAGMCLLVRTYKKGFNFNFKTFIWQTNT